MDELDAGDTRADDDEVLRKLGRRVGVSGGQNPVAVDRSPVRDTGAGTGAENDHVGGEDFAGAVDLVDLHFMRRQQVAAAVDFNGSIRWDHSKPDGTPKKQLDVSRLASMGWRARIALSEGLISTVSDFEQTEQPRGLNGFTTS